MLSSVDLQVPNTKRNVSSIPKQSVEHGNPERHVPRPKGLVTNYGRGGLQNGRRGAREVLPLQKKGGGGGGKSYTRAEGVAQKVLG